MSFVVCKNIPLVPVFLESEVETYFSAFEHITAALSWPLDVWALLLQCNCVVKLRKCASLSAVDSLSYETLNGAVLQAYELVSEVYLQRFRGLKEEPEPDLH